MNRTLYDDRVSQFDPFLPPLGDFEHTNPYSMEIDPLTASTQQDTYVGPGTISTPIEGMDLVNPLDVFEQSTDDISGISFGEVNENPHGERSPIVYDLLQFPRTVQNTINNNEDMLNTSEDSLVTHTTTVVTRTSSVDTNNVNTRRMSTYDNYENSSMDLTEVQGGLPEVYSHTGSRINQAMGGGSSTVGLQTDCSMQMLKSPEQVKKHVQFQENPSNYNLFPEFSNTESSNTYLKSVQSTSTPIMTTVQSAGNHGNIPPVTNTFWTPTSNFIHNSNVHGTCAPHIGPIGYIPPYQAHYIPGMTVYRGNNDAGNGYIPQQTVQTSNTMYYRPLMTQQTHQSRYKIPDSYVDTTENMSLL